VIDYRQVQQDALTAARGDRAEATLIVEKALLSAEAGDDGHAAYILETTGRKGLRHDLNVHKLVPATPLIEVIKEVSMADDTVKQVLALLERAGAEMDRGKEHCKVAQAHFRNREWARAAAHSWAAQGHLVTARERLDELAKVHASKSELAI